jgi:UDP-GlcNAc3NAcA epimerase
MDMVILEKYSRLIATDSGGVQKEAFFYRVPCVTLREETEWVELVALGWNVCVPPTERSVVYEGIKQQLNFTADEQVAATPYGKGDAGSLISEHLVGQESCENS